MQFLNIYKNDNNWESGFKYFLSPWIIENWFAKIKIQENKPTDAINIILKE